MKLYHPTIPGMTVTVTKKAAADWLASGWVQTDPHKTAPATE